MPSPGPERALNQSSRARLNNRPCLRLLNGFRSILRSILLTTAPAGDSLFGQKSWHLTSPQGGCVWLPLLPFGSRLFCLQSSSSSPAPSCTCFCLTTAATTSSSPKRTSFLPPCELLA